MDEEPVFIVGTPRSGTSILYRSVLLHSEFYPGEVCLTETEIFLNSSRVLPYLRGEKSLYEYMLGKDKIYNKFVNKVYPVAIAQRLPERVIRPLWPYSKTIWKALGGEHIVKSFFEMAWRARKKKRIVEKTPRHIECVEYINCVYEKCKIIFTIRHPIDVFSSYLRRRKIDRYKEHYTKEKFVQIYKKHMKIIKNEQKKDNTKCIHYNEFTRNTEKEYKELCSFLEIDYESRPITQRVDSLSGWEPDPYLSEPITPSTKDWREYISLESARWIEERLSSTMSTFGFDYKSGRRSG